MARESREVWAKRVERWKDSGLTAKEFADELGIKAQTLSFWKWRLGTEQRRAATTTIERARPPGPARRRAATTAPMPARVEFVEVAPMPATPPDPTPPMFEVVLGGGAHVRVPMQFDAPALSALLSVIEGR